MRIRVYTFSIELTSAVHLNYIYIRINPIDRDIYIYINMYMRMQLINYITVRIRIRTETCTGLKFMHAPRTAVSRSTANALVVSNACMNFKA